MCAKPASVGLRDFKVFIHVLVKFGLRMVGIYGCYSKDLILIRRGGGTFLGQGRNTLLRALSKFKKGHHTLPKPNPPLKKTPRIRPLYFSISINIMKIHNLIQSYVKNIFWRKRAPYHTLTSPAHKVISFHFSDIT